MTTRELGLMAGTVVPETPAERVIARAAGKPTGQVAGLLLANRELSLGCEEHEFGPTPGYVPPKDGASPDDLRGGELNRPYQCRLCGYRVSRAFVRAYAAERAARDEERRWRDS